MVKKPLNKISEYANNYLDTKKDESLNSLIVEADFLVKGILRKYNFPKVDVEDIERECLSVILVKSLRSYKRKKAKFSTHYYWTMRSYLANKIKYYNRDKRKGYTISLDDPVGRDGNKTLYLKDIVTKIKGRIVMMLPEFPSICKKVI